MSDQEAQQEPSMEEILASIRRIISEDGDEETAAAPEAEAATPEPVEEAAPEPEEPAEPEEDVLELTDEVQDDGTVVNLNTGEAVEEEETPEEFVESLEAEEEEIELEMVRHHHLQTPSIYRCLTGRVGRLHTHTHTT